MQNGNRKGIAQWSKTYAGKKLYTSILFLALTIIAFSFATPADNPACNVYLYPCSGYGHIQFSEQRSIRH